MSKYYKAEEVQTLINSLKCYGIPELNLDGLPTIEVSEEVTRPFEYFEGYEDGRKSVEVSEDCISRQGVIRDLRLEYPDMPLFRELRDEWQLKTEGYRKAEEIIRTAPSVIPKPKAGER